MNTARNLQQQIITRWCDSSSKRSLYLFHIISMFLFCNRCICINCKKITAVKMLPSIINKHCEMRNYTEANAQQYFLYYTNPTSTLFALNKYGITMSSTLCQHASSLFN